MMKFISGVTFAVLLSGTTAVHAQVNAADSVMTHAKGNKLSLGGYGEAAYSGSVLKPSCKPIPLSTQFNKYLLPLHHEESPIITLHLSRCTCRLL